MIYCSWASFYAEWARATPGAGLAHVLKYPDLRSCQCWLFVCSAGSASASEPAAAGLLCCHQQTPVQWCGITTNCLSGMGKPFVLPWQLPRGHQSRMDGKEEGLAGIWIVCWQKAHEQLFISRVFLCSSEYILPVMETWLVVILNLGRGDAAYWCFSKCPSSLFCPLYQKWMQFKI